ncbi:MAG: hypothetical protein LQ343_002951 [Gyalolechia ehrenbergii]|nr:MAG: hypothetical protein LQ343_002951 [Gyalolechia ehrenbergii]
MAYSPKLGLIIRISPYELYIDDPKSDKDDDQMIRDKVFEGEADIKERKQPGGQKSIFYDLITGDDLPPEEKTLARLEAEAVTLVAAE